MKLNYAISKIRKNRQLCNTKNIIKMDKETRYKRIFDQLEELLKVTTFPCSRMSTIIAVLHHKMEGFLWTGFYLLHEEELLVASYQGPLACQKLNKNTGVCWAGINQMKSIIVPDVHQFPGHIACDSRSNSEIVIPVFNQNKEIVGVLDIDSKNYNHFNEIDSEWLTKIVDRIYI